MSKKTAHKKEHSVITHKHNGTKWSRPKSGWGSAGSEKGKNNRVKLALLLLGLLFLLILIGKIFNIITGFQKPIYADSAVQRNYIWDKESKINFVVEAKDLSIVSFDPSDKKVTILKLPDNLYVNVPNGLGDWKVSSVYELGQTSSEKNGGNLLKQSISNFLGIPVEGYVIFKNDLAEKGVSDLLENIRDGFWNGYAMTADINTDFTPIELLGLNSGLRGLRFDKVVSYNLEDFNVLDEKILPDGTVVYTSDPVRVDSIASKFFDTEISEEKVPVAVFNSTDFPGLAQKAARIISNLGGNVIMSTNGSNNEDKTIVYVKDIEENAATPQVLGQIFASDCSDSLKCDIIVCNLQENTTNKQSFSTNRQSFSTDELCEPDPEVLESRAPINVVLGEDFQARF